MWAGNDSRPQSRLACMHACARRYGYIDPRAITGSRMATRCHRTSQPFSWLVVDKNSCLPNLSQKPQQVSQQESYTDESSKKGHQPRPCSIHFLSTGSLFTTVFAKLCFYYDVVKYATAKDRETPMTTRLKRGLVAIHLTSFYKPTTHNFFSHDTPGHVLPMTASRRVSIKATKPLL